MSPSRTAHRWPSTTCSRWWPRSGRRAFLLDSRLHFFRSSASATGAFASDSDRRAALSMLPMCVGAPHRPMRSSLQVTSAVGISRSGGAPGTPSAWETPPAARLPRRLVLKGGFTVIDRQQRRLHNRAHTLGFPDLHSYLVARSQPDASLTQLAGELHTTIDVIGRLIGEGRHPALLTEGPQRPSAPPGH